MSDAASARPSDARVHLIEGALLVLVALACLVFQLRLPGKSVADADYQRLAADLDREAQPGDVVLLYPWWTERARSFIPEKVQVVGYLGSDGDALELNPRIWVVAQPGLPRSDVGEFMKAFGPSRVEVGSERQYGNLSLRLFKNGRARPVRFSASDALARASVYLERDGTRQACEWNGSSFRCARGEVKLEWHELKYVPRHCLRFFPPGGPVKLVMEMNGVPASDALSLQAGYIWEHAVQGGATTTLGLEVNGQTSLLSLPALTDGQQRIEAQHTPDNANVRVWVQAQDPTNREVCFELYGFGASP